MWDGEAELAAAGGSPGRQAPELRGGLRGDLHRRAVLRRHARKRAASARPHDLPRRRRRLSLGPGSRRRASATKRTACSKKSPRPPPQRYPAAGPAACRSRTLPAAARIGPAHPRARAPLVARRSPPTWNALAPSSGACACDYGYTLELPSREVADPLAYFLFDRRKGHCEYFASAMTVMLRDHRHPGAAGHRLSERHLQPDDRALAGARLRRAYLGGGVDSRAEDGPPSTPRRPTRTRRTSRLMARLGLYLDAAETFWQQWVVGYDAGQQGSLADRMEQRVRRMGVNWFDSRRRPRAPTGTSAAWRGRADTGSATVIVVVASALRSGSLGPPLLRLLRMPPPRAACAPRRGQRGGRDAAV